MAVDSKARLKDIVNSYLDKDGGAGIDTRIRLNGDLIAVVHDTAINLAQDVNFVSFNPL